MICFSQFYWIAENSSSSTISISSQNQTQTIKWIPLSLSVSLSSWIENNNWSSTFLESWYSYIFSRITNSTVNKIIFKLSFYNLSYVRQNEFIINGVRLFTADFYFLFFFYLQLRKRQNFFIRNKLKAV